VPRVPLFATATALTTLGALGLLACDTAVDPGAAGALDRPSTTPPEGVTATPLARSSLAEVNVRTKTDTFSVSLRTRQTTDVAAAQLSIAPGGTTGWHTHPGPVIIAITAGALTFYSGDDPDCAPTVYAAGTGFVDPGGGHVHIARNEGSVSVELVQLGFTPVGADVRIDAPDPGNCDF
jgi:quercetin dioxygenase-like cupin family protein